MNDKVILQVSDNGEGQYSVTISEGSSVAETAFAMAIVIKCLVRDKIIENTEVFTKMLDKYLTDPQFKELES